jgi:hypothetical protein
MKKCQIDYDEMEYCLRFGKHPRGKKTWVFRLSSAVVGFVDIVEYKKCFYAEAKKRVLKAAVKQQAARIMLVGDK